MFKLYYAAAIDTCVEQAFKQIDEFKKVFKPYILDCCECVFEYQLESTPEQVKKCDNCHKIEVFGAGFGESPIIGSDSSSVYKGVTCSYDYRLIRQCDILLVVTNLEQFCAGTMMELEYARNLGIYTIVLILQKKVSCIDCEDKGLQGLGNGDFCANHCDNMFPKLKNIFLETFCNKIIYSMEELEEILKDLI